LRSALNNLRLDLSTLKTQPLLTSKIILAVLKEKINIQQSNRNFMTGNITFCALHPMRSIPAKIICLLGMDHDKFPKSGSKYGFDLIRSVPREGDRSSNLDERQLFLDLILSARDHLFISYTGKGIRDNKTRPPSPCLEELYQWLCSVFGKQDCFRQQHPLQAFSGK
jgi:exodeoxyribonuclease V gamma subunit